MRMPTINSIKTELNRPKDEGGEEERIVLTAKYDKGDVIQAWKEFVLKADQAGKISQVIILKDRPLDVENDVISISLENQLQLDQLNEFKEELMVYIRKRIQNTSIILNAAIGEVNTQKRIYTVEEKFKFLEEKHPDLVKLKDLFGLETDY